MPPLQTFSALCLRHWMMPLLTLVGWLESLTPTNQPTRVFDSNQPTRVKRGIIQCLRHRAEMVCSGGTRWKELGHLRQVFKANGYPETVVNRNLRARPTPRISTQTSQTPPSSCSYPTSQDSVKGLRRCVGHWE